MRPEDGRRDRVDALQAHEQRGEEHRRQQQPGHRGHARGGADRDRRRDVEPDHGQRDDRDPEVDRREDRPAAEPAAEADRVGQALEHEQDDHDLRRAFGDELRHRGLAREEHVLRVGAEQIGGLGQDADREAAAEKEERHRRPRHVFNAVCEAADGGDHDRRQHADDDREDQVVDVRPLVRGQPGLGEARRSEAAPVAEADEDDVAGRRGDESGEERRREGGTEARCAGLDHQHAADDRPAEERRDGREGAGAGEERTLLLPQAQDRRDHQADDHPERDQRHLRPEDRAERERAHGRERDPRRVRERRRRFASEPDQRRHSAVSGQEAARDEDDEGARQRDAEDEVPRWRGVAEAVRKRCPEPVLEVVDEGEEERGEERGRDADQGSEPDQLEVRRAAEVVSLFGQAAPSLRPSRTAVR